MKSIRCFLLGVGLLFAFQLSKADDHDAFRVERGSIAYRDGGTVDRVLHLYPEQNHGEAAFEQPVQSAGTGCLRIHFNVVSDPSDSSWFVELLDRSGRTAWKSSDVDRKRGEFWSGEISGDRGDVILHLLGGNRDVRIQIDKLAITGIESKPQSITTKREDIVPIKHEPADIQQLGRSIVRIRFIGDDGGRYFCTGFLIATNILMTNQHCFSSAKEATSALIDFDFDAPKTRPKTVAVSEFLWNNFDLDYALARLSEVPDSRSALPLSVEPIHLGEDLIVIQHPEGQFKQVSLINCQASADALVRGRGTSQTDFSHLCNTVGGSSGSAVWDRGSRKVIGLHHFGFSKGADKPSNQAVDMGIILEDIFAHDPNIYWSLSINNPAHPKPQNSAVK